MFLLTIKFDSNRQVYYLPLITGTVVCLTHSCLILSTLLLLNRQVYYLPLITGLVNGFLTSSFIMTSFRSYELFKQH